MTRLHYHPLRTCQVCATPYWPSYHKQRSCSRTCGITLKGQRIGGGGRQQRLSKRDLNAPITKERQWCEAQAKKRASQHMLTRYHADPANWTTARKRRRLFERDGWHCRAVAGHILAKATGGEWTNENMATLCHPCNVIDGVNKIPIQTSVF